MTEPPLPAQVVEALKPQINAMEILLILIACASGLQNLLLDETPIGEILGMGWAIAWALGLCIGSVLALTGIFWRGRAITSISLQELGYTAFTATCLARAMALYAVGNDRSAPVILLFALASAARLYQLERRVRRAPPDGPLGRWRRARG